MRLLLLTCVVVLMTSSLPAAQTSVTGKWRTTETVPLGPYEIELVQQGSKVTGAIWQSGRASDIRNGVLQGNSLVFTLESPDRERMITFKGTVVGDVIHFARDVKVKFGGAKGGRGFLGADGVKAFKVSRDKPGARAVAPPASATADRRSAR
jgi:hypothetical protein